jgi:rRNA maturation endonuclease Nob1
MLLVADTSSLIGLQKLGWLGDLRHQEDTCLCPVKVIQELKNDRKLIKWLKEGAVITSEVEKPLSISGISETDVEVISLAFEKGGSILSEDVGLGQKAKRIGIPVYNITRLVVLYYQYGRIDQNTCLTRLRTLVTEKMLSQDMNRQLLEIIKR